MDKYTITTDTAPAAIGPYSQAVRAGDMLFISGQIPIDPLTGTMPNDIKSQTRQALENIKSIIGADGGKLTDVIKCTVFLTDMNTFSEMNEAYSEYFSCDFPARAAVEVSRLPKDADIEIEAIAYIK